MLQIITRAATDDPPWLDTAVGWALLERTTAGTAPETLFLSRPGRVVAFGPADRLLPGFEAAREAAREVGFAPVNRLAGGHAAIFHEQTIAFSWTVPDVRARTTIHLRFGTMASLVEVTLRRLGVDARVGRVTGEYCPGAYSVGARGRTKLMGVGQRVLPAAAYVGGVIVVDGADLVRSALSPVYRELGIEWDPTTAGSVREEVKGVTWDDVVTALIDTVTSEREVRLTDIDPALVAEAQALEAKVTDSKRWREANEGSNGR